MTFLIAVLLIQQKEPKPVVLPPGSSDAFQSTAYAVQAAVDEGDWTEAARLANRLPDFDLTVQWDDSLLNAEQKKEFVAARDEAVANWTAGVKDLKVTFKPKGELKIGFAPDLPPNIDSPGPAGAVYIDSPADGDPFVEAVWALARGTEKRATTPVEIRNEAQYAIGAALGLARFPRPPSVMFRAEDNYYSRNIINPGDGRLALGIIEVADTIRKAVAEKRDPKIGAPQVFINPIQFKPSPVGQAEEMSLTLQVTNQGKGTWDPLESTCRHASLSIL